MSIGNGGKAFPSGSSGGMSLRDYFAAKAMSEYIAKGYNYQEAARYSYSLADAMLAARGDA